MNNMIILKPYDLVLAYPDNSLSISLENKTATMGEDEILIRFEEDRNLLFVDSRIARRYGLENTINTWRGTAQYAGPMQKRMLAGTGMPAPARNAICFDLSENPGARQERIPTRRGKQLKIEKERARAVARKEIETASLRAYRRLQDEEIKTQDKEILEIVRDALKEAKDWYEKAYNMLSIGKRPRNPDSYKRLRGSKLTPPPVWCEGIDELIRKDTAGIHKLVDVYKTVNDKPKRIKKEFVPDIDPSAWIGRYEEAMKIDGTGHFKQLFIPVSILNDDLYDKPTLTYRLDPRYVKSLKKRVGDHTQQCALFNLLITK